MNRLAMEQHRRNRQSRDAWEIFANHRRHVTQLIVQACPGLDPRLCVLGCGNCNDLDLVRLASVFREIHLVDLDEEAVSSGVARQGAELSTSLHVHAGVDVTQALTYLDSATSLAPPGSDRLEAWFAALAQLPALSLDGPFAVVASCCLLSQLVDSVTQSLGAKHPRLLEGILTVRHQHLRLLLELTRPGGISLLITDFVSSLTTPELAGLDDEAIAHLAPRWIRDHNYFTGLNPLAVYQQFKQLPVAVSQVAELTLCKPWRWDLGPRAYAVTAIRAVKRTTGATAE